MISLQLKKTNVYHKLYIPVDFLKNNVPYSAKKKPNKRKATLFNLAPLRRASFLKTSRNCYANRRRLRYKRRTKFPMKFLKQFVTRRLKLTKIRAGRLYVKNMRRNSFFNVSRKLKNKKKNKYSKKKLKSSFAVLISMSIGHLHSFRGRARSSSIALRALARRLSKKLKRNV